MIDLLNGFDLRRCETGRSVAALAQQHLRVEVTAPRIIEDTILDSVEGVARVVDRIGQSRHLVGRDVAVALSRENHPEVADLVMRPKIRRVAGHDAVKIVRIPFADISASWPP